MPRDAPVTNAIGRLSAMTATVQPGLTRATPRAEPGDLDRVGDVDEAVSGLLTNGIVASNVNGETVPAGFTRILAYRLGLSGEADQCFHRFL